MSDNQQNNVSKKPKLSPEQLFDIYQECSLPNAPVKAILDRYGLKPWHLLALRKRIKQAALSELANPSKPGKKKSMVPVENLAQVDKELSQAKDALAAVGHELALLKKKDELNLKGPLKGHYPANVRKIVVNAINEAVLSGFTQKRACLIFDIDARKLRRWANPKVIKPRTACNKLLPYEKTAIIESAFRPENIGKPLSHIFVYGHNTGTFHASLSTVYRYLKAEDLVKPFEPKRRKPKHISAHDLLDAGFSLVTYDGSCFKTDSGATVWSIPVLLLPCRYLLHIGHSLRGVSSADLRDSVAQAILEIPDSFTDSLVAFSDRGSAMKAKKTTAFLEDILKIPVCFGRPNTPDDEPWIESLNKNSKYHRDVPVGFATVADVLDWLQKFRTTYNNEPHSALHYVTPAEALAGKMEVILNQRKNNLIAANKMRLEAFRASGLQVVIR